MSTVSSKLFFNNFLENKLLLAKSIAASIDDNKPSGFRYIEAYNNPDFWRYIKYFQDIYNNKLYKTCFISYNYYYTRGKIYYCIDGDKTETDNI